MENPVTAIETARLIPWLPAAGAVVCGLCCTKKALRPVAGAVCILSIFSSFVLSVLVSGFVWKGEGGHEPVRNIVTAFEWIRVGGFKADMSYLIDPLTVVMLMVVTGIGSLVAVYASGYMSGDRGYARFFAYVCLFIFAMLSLVMADNLVLLYLGWEGVGLCSYLLIGYYYHKPSAVAAAKKAFIVNRIGDLGFALGIFLIYQKYGTVSLGEVADKAKYFRDAGTAVEAADIWIPFLLMMGAFGKSAQLPLYVWLPDAMEGPTPVSALIHAATMVTAGVYMIARLLPVFEYSPYALPTVAAVGGATALFAGTIALCQYDIKRIYAYSTVSQLGYMFLGLGALSSVGAAFHLMTHAFFKALLFLTAGSVMHSLAGQLDLRKMSGLRKKMPVTCVLMFVGCLSLAGFPLTAGFFSKDMILAAVMEKGLGGGGSGGSWLYYVLGMMGLATAFLTAYYTFRLWFRVFMGPTVYEMGEEGHGHEEAGHDAGQHGHGGHEKERGHGKEELKAEHQHDAHEVSWLMNAPLVVLAVGALAAGVMCEGWIEHMVNGSTAKPVVHGGGGHGHGPTLFGWDLHVEMMVISGVISAAGIGLAAYYHWLRRAAADRLAEQFPGVVRMLANKYYVDEIYDGLIVRPLRVLGSVFYILDRLVIDGLVAAVGFGPRVLGLSIQPLQRGRLQGYGLSMAAGAAMILLVVVWAARHS